MGEVYYKILNEDGSARMGVGKWHLPTEDGPGEWMPPIQGDLIPCENGYHLCREKDLMSWLGPAIFEAEAKPGEMVEGGDKVVVREARLLRHLELWDHRTACLFAADCAERVLHIFEETYPGDDRPRKAIEAVRSLRRSKIDIAAAHAAAYAAYAAAATAAYAAAYAADHTATAATAACYAAARAAAAAHPAAYGVAHDAGRAGERQWQRQRLFQYLRGEVE